MKPYVEFPMTRWPPGLSRTLGRVDSVKLSAVSGESEGGLAESVILIVTQPGLSRTLGRMMGNSIPRESETPPAISGLSSFQPGVSRTLGHMMGNCIPRESETPPRSPDARRANTDGQQSLLVRAPLASPIAACRANTDHRCRAGL